MPNYNTNISELSFGAPTIAAKGAAKRSEKLVSLEAVGAVGSDRLLTFFFFFVFGFVVSTSCCNACCQVTTPATLTVDFRFLIVGAGGNKRISLRLWF